MEVFFCARCGVPLTGPVVELDDLTLVRGGDGADYVPRGSYLPVARLADEHGAVELGVGGGDELIFNLDDLRNTEPGGVRNGCCGLEGLDGVNTFCANGHEIGTERSDCWTPRFLHAPSANLVTTPAPRGTAMEGNALR